MPFDFSASASGVAPAVVPTGGSPGPSGLDAYQLWLTQGNVGSLADYQATLVSRVPGPKGDPSSVPGPPGTGTTTTRVAAVAIPASTYVVDQPGLQCVVADPTNAAHRGKVLGLVVQATSAGQQATIQSIGAIAGVVGTFGPGDTLYIGDGTTGRTGSIVNLPPSAGWRQSVGTATTAALINALLGEARLINAGSALLLRAGGFALQASPADVTDQATGVWIDPASAADLIEVLTGALVSAALTANAADQATALAGNDPVKTPSVLRVRQMLEQFGATQFARFGARLNADTDAARAANGKGMADAVDLILGVGRGVLELPGADIHMGAKVSRTFASKAIGFRGQGDATRIICTAAAGSHGWLDLYSSDHLSTYGIRDLVGVPRGACTGVFARMDMKYQGARQDTSVRCYGVTVAPYGINTPDYFGGGNLSFGGSWHADISGVYITGPYGVDIWADSTDTSPKYASAFGVALNDAYDYMASRVSINCVAIGISDQSVIPIGGLGQPATQAEGGVLRDFRIVSAKQGFIRRRTSGVSGEEDFKLELGHINCRDNNLIMDGVTSGNVRDILFYADDSKAGPQGCVDITIKNTSRTKVVYPEFYGYGPSADTRRRNIIIDPAVYAQYIDVIAPFFGAVASNGIWVLPGPNASNIRMLDHTLYPASAALLSLDQSSPASLTVATR